MTLNMGPQHPATHGVLRIELDLDGETVIEARPIIGYLHTGIEKNMEAKTYTQALTMTDRMDYLAPMSNNLVYVSAIEKLMELEIPPRAEYIRVILTELTRLNSHLVWIGTHAIDIGAMSMLLYAFREREKITQMYEFVSGVRMMSSYFRVGGITQDVPTGFEDRVNDILNIFPAKIDEYEGLLTDNKIWRNRTIGVGTISAEDAIDAGLSGPSLRGSGVTWDIRKSKPYSYYDKFEFDIPTRPKWRCLRSLPVRLEEMRQSLRIIRQAFDGLPGWPGDDIGSQSRASAKDRSADRHGAADSSFQIGGAWFSAASRRCLLLRLNRPKAKSVAISFQMAQRNHIECISGRRRL